MKLAEKLRLYDKEEIFESYIRIVKKYKSYNSVSKKKMLDEIEKTYADVHNIIDICMVPELKFLEKLLNGDKDCQDREKYSFEIDNLQRKFLIFSYPNVVIADELLDKVRLALEEVDWDQVKENDRINEVLVGICKVYGKIMLQPLLNISSYLLGMDNSRISNHIAYNKVFQYYVYFHVDKNDTMGVELPMFIYQDYYTLLDELEEARKKYKFAPTKEICKEDYINIFYYGFNINQKDVKNFYDVLVKNEHYDVMKAFVLETSLLNGDRDVLRFFLDNFVKGDKKFYELLNKALDEMPSAALNGGTPTEFKYARLEHERNRYQKEVQYLKQVNAKLSKKEVQTFYQIYFALLEFTNGKYHINTKMKKIYKQKSINPNELIDIIEKFWEDKDDIIDEFLEKNPYRFGEYEKKLVKGVKRGFRDLFIIARYERNYTCFLMGGKCYMVKGLHDNLDNIISYQKLPCFVKTSILPFGENIIFDSVLQAMPGISMGSNFETLVNEELVKVEKIYQL